MTLTQQCVYEATARCDTPTIQSVMTRLQYVEGLWEDLVCQPKEILNTCFNLFEKEAREIFNFEYEDIFDQMVEVGSTQ